MYSSSKDDSASALKSSAQNLGSNLEDSARDAKNNLTNTANQAGRKVLDFIHSAGDGVSQATGTVTKEIRSNPVQSSFIALGVGYLLGILTRRS